MFRTLIGLTAVILLLFGGTLYIARPELQPVSTAMAIRIGLLLAVIWLAFPNLERWKHRLPTMLVSTVLVCLIIVAAKPKLGRLIAVLAAVTFSVSAILRWLQKQSSPP